VDPGSGRHTEEQMNINKKDESSRYLGPQHRQVQKLEPSVVDNHTPEAGTR